MARVVLVSHDVQTVKDGQAGGVGAFVTHFARLLRHAGEDVTILLTRQETFPVHVDEPWRKRYDDLGVRLIEVHNDEQDPTHWCDPWSARLSRKVAPLLAGFDIAYFQDWANTAFHAARLKRYGGIALPVLVTVLHGPSEWIRVGEERYADVPHGLHQDYIERYAAKNSDFVIAPSRYILQWALSHRWQFRHDAAVLGLPYMADPIPAPVVSGSSPTRLIYFGRLETRKGLGLFVAALRLLAKTSPAVIQSLREIVFLGQEKDAGAFLSAQAALADLAVPLVHLGGFDSAAANKYLAAHRHDSIVVVPSRAENFPYAVIEASSILGLNLLCSNGGGIPEVMGDTRANDLFEPHPPALAGNLAERLTSPSDPNGKAPYDAAAANARWLGFHQEALEEGRAYAPSSAQRLTSPPARVDICIPHFNHSDHLKDLLETLEREASRNYGVIVVDDGSRAGEKAAFDMLAEQYRDKGWQFVSQPNLFVDAARNRAASMSYAEYLLFIDADDLPAPLALSKLLSAITHSGDDCLVAGGLLFESDTWAQSLEHGTFAASYMPLGPDLVLGLLDPMVLGTSMVLVRRTAFESVGGYRTVRGAAHEDWELQIKLMMAGFKVDVFPEFLLYFRKSADGLSRNSDEYFAQLRLIESYDEVLGQAGLHGLAASCVGLLKRCRDLEAALTDSRDVRTQRLHGLVGDMLRRKGLAS